MATPMDEIFSHIKSMRDCDKPRSYEDIKTFLLTKGFDEVDIDHAIIYAEEAERQQGRDIKETGGFWDNILSLIGALGLLIIGLVALGFAIYLTVKLVNTLGNRTFTPGMTTYEAITAQTPKGRTLFTTVVLLGSSIPAIYYGIISFIAQRKIRKTYLKRKEQKLL